MSNVNLQPGDLYAILGLFAGVVAGFIGLANVMLKQSTKDREADRLERKELSEAIQRMAKSSDKVAEATVRGANEAKQRNGHLGELVMESAKTNQKLAESATGTIISAIASFQKVDTQKVEHQIIAHTENADDKK